MFNSLANDIHVSCKPPALCHSVWHTCCELHVDLTFCSSLCQLTFSLEAGGISADPVARASVPAIGVYANL